ncbi:MAG: ferrochelatase, partial [Eggerthellaceae bacterium]|nr:ferrochelatase [Eggerthellaceae bacterium]
MSGKQESRTGVILVNTGTPEEPTQMAVHEYLCRFLTDKRIRPMNFLGWILILHLFILRSRDTSSTDKYKLIWTEEGSPLKIGQEKLARG